MLSELCLRSRILEPVQQLAIFSLYLRHNIPFELIAAIMQVSESTVSRTISRIQPLLAANLGSLINIGTHEERMESSVMLLDGTEQPTFSTKDPVLNTRYYSAKKKQHSINILVGCCPRKKKILYPCSKNDLQIAREEARLWHGPLTQDENVIADSGFCGLEDEKLRVITPHRKNPMLQARMNRKISEKRIFIERLNRKIKEINIFLIFFMFVCVFRL